MYTIVLAAVLIAVFFKWIPSNYEPNLMGGDAKDYYAPLVSTFITHDFANQTGSDWFILKTNSGTINVHTIGVSVLLLPFFLMGYLFASLGDFAVDGYSLPFQISVAFAALVYVTIGLNYLKKLLQLNGIGDKTSALVLALIFIGTNLLQYSIFEAGMSHVYSFALISVFMYHSCAYVYHLHNKNLFLSALMFGLIVLVRPNNLFILLSVLFWFRSWAEFKSFTSGLFRNKKFYAAAAVSLLVVSAQSLVWLIQSNSVFHNTYKADGFYWLNPQLLKMLFGFDGGFFIYTPLCLLFILGLIFIYKQNRFSFYATVSFLFILFYFFSCYWAYTYFDGLGIRVLVDYYALFAFMGAKLFSHFSDRESVYGSLVAVALAFSFLNLVYTWQINNGILLRAGMNFNKWKYVFMKTSEEYKNVLGGANELVPYAATKPEAFWDDEFKFSEPFDFKDKDYGVTLLRDTLGFNSNRLNFQIACSRKESAPDASRNAIVCIVVNNKPQKKSKCYTSFKLNETPSLDCCYFKEYSYSMNIFGDFRSGDEVACFLWNPEKKGFWVDKFSVKVYNYNYDIN